MRLSSTLVWGSLSLALTACGSSDPVTPTPPPPPPPPVVATVTVTPTTAALVVGRSTQLTATPRDAAGVTLTRTVTWSSASNAVATVSATGLVTAVAPGQTEITATSESASGRVTVTVSPVPVASVTLSSLGALVPRAAQRLTVTVRDSAGATLAGRAITWASADATIATVSDSGMVTAVAAGTTRITATVEGRSAEVQAVVRDGGLITSAGGTATGASGALSLTVPANAVVEPVALMVDRIAEPPAHPRLVNGTTFRIAPATTAFAQPAALRIAYGTLPASSRALQLRVHRWDGTAWQPLTSTVDTVAARVSAAVTSGGDYALIEVPLPVATVVVTPTTVSLMKGDTARLTASVRAANGEVLSDRPVTWTSSNPAAVSVTSTGLITALAPDAGVTITATSEARTGSAQVTVTVPFNFASISLGAFHSCGLTPEGEAWCWGDSGSCETGVEPCIDARPLPVRVNTTVRFASLSLGEDYTCGLSTTGAAWCWGLNENGNLGHTTFGASGTPTAVSGGLRFTSLSGGPRHLCGLVGDGQTWCWGSNSSGQLGTGGSAGVVSTPTQVTGAPNFVLLQSGSRHNCGLTADGIAWCWGENSDGESGDGSGVDVPRPVRVAGNHVFTTISVGEFHACGLKSTGALWCWGWNESGQIGDGFMASRYVPVAVSGNTQFASVTAFGWSTCGLTATGEAKCWGENLEGQLGIGSSANQSSPTSVSGSLRFRALAGGGLAYHMCGITTSDVWYCWGWNNNGQLGDGTMIDRHVPTRLPMPAMTSVMAAGVRSGAATPKVTPRLADPKARHARR